MKFLLVLLLLIPVIMAKYDSKEPHEEGEKANEAQTLNDTVKGNIEFAITLFKHVTSVSSRGKDSPPKNVVMSPLSISSAFAMLSLGARSKTHQEIWEGLCLNNTHSKEKQVHQAFSNILKKLNEPKNSFQLDVGNAIFLDNEVALLKSFEDDAEQYYHAEIKQEDFSAQKEVVNKINEYVKDKTNGKIRETIKDLPENAKMVLLNYVYFKGEWVNTFHQDRTRPAKFSVDNDTTVDVQMMSRTGSYKTYYDEKLSCTVVELPYKGNASMIIALADPGKIHKVEQGISAGTIHQWITSSEPGTIELHMPKYSISSSMDLKKELPALGFKTAFTDLADFSGITNGGALKVGEATHKAVLDVDEKGTEAAAVTAIGMVPTALFSSLIIDRPFVCLIYDHITGSILFIATVMNPVEK